VYDPNANHSVLDIPSIEPGEDPLVYERRRQSVIDWNEAHGAPNQDAGRDEEKDGLEHRLDAVKLNGVGDDIRPAIMEITRGNGDLGVEVEKAS
jgi:hypothetical protein